MGGIPPSPPRISATARAKSNERVSQARSLLESLKEEGVWWGWCGEEDTHLFPERERDIFVLDHVLDLLLHRHGEEHDPVQQQHGPEHWEVKHGEEGHGEPNQD